MKKIIEIILAPILVLAFLALIFLGSSQRKNVLPVSGANDVSNISVVDGKQIIEINARGGYSPRTSVAKAGLPTILRFKTSGTFDCSSSIRISSLNISRNLVSSGVTDIDLGVPSTKTLQGTCGMGMYPFEIDFL